MINEIFKDIDMCNDMKTFLSNIARPFKILVKMEYINGEKLAKPIFVGDNGCIYNSNNKELGSINGAGYITTRLKMVTGESKSFKRNRIIAEALLKDYREDLLVDHINGIKIDDRIENLRMVNHSDNLKNKLTLDVEAEINRLKFLKLEHLRNLDRIDKKIQKLKQEAL